MQVVLGVPLGQVLLGLLLVACLAVAVAHRRVPAPGRALLAGVERLTDGWPPWAFGAALLVLALVAQRIAYGLWG